MAERLKFANLFEGQGQLAVGGGVWKVLYSDPSFQKVFNHADELSVKLGLGFMVSEACFAIENSPLAPDSYNPVAAQLVLLTGQTATMEFMHANGLPRAAVNGGHSLGQLGGAVESGFLLFDPAFRITKDRALAMQKVAQVRKRVVAVVFDFREEAGGLVSTIQQDLAELGEEVKNTKISGLNHVRQISLVGPYSEIIKLKNRASRPQLKIKVMPQIPWSHHPDMEPAQREWNRIIGQVKRDFSDITETPLLSDVKKRLMTRANSFIASLRVQLKSPVLWNYTLRRINGMGLRHAMEVGQGDIFPAMASIECPEVKIHLINSLEAIDESLNVLGDSVRRYYFLETVASPNPA